MADVDLTPVPDDPMEYARSVGHTGKTGPAEVAKVVINTRKPGHGSSHSSGSQSST